MDRGAIANRYHDSGYNCAQAVFTACADLTGLPQETAKAIAGSFGAGARCGNLCGALTGGLMALGLLHPYTDSRDIDAKERIRVLTLEFEARFVKEHRFLLCQQLLGMSFEDAKARGISQKTCPALINTACRLVEQMR